MTHELKRFKRYNCFCELSAHSKICMYLYNHIILRKLHVNFLYESRKINSYNIILLTQKQILCQTVKNL